MLKTTMLSVVFFYMCNGYRILLIFPTPYKSHAILGEAFVRLLIEAGHEVTYVTPYLIKNADKNLHQVEIGTKGLLDDTISVNNIFKRDINTQDSFLLFNGMMSLMNKTLSDDNVVELLNNQSVHFDVAVIERMFIDVYSGFSAVFNCPYISFFSYHNDMEILELIHDMPNPSYTANVGTANIPPLSFYQRVEELILQILGVVLRKYYFEPREKELYENKFKNALRIRGKDLPPYEEIKFNASLVLSTSHVTVGNSYIQPSSLKLIGGFHIDDKLQPLPKKLHEIMDTSENGVILFSMGSQLTSEGMPEEMKKDILRIFSNLKYTVLWKSDEIAKNAPENVKFVSWIPQQSVLAHPNCILFITHGGILSVTESIYFGVPIVGIPGFGDQFINIKTAVKNGIAKEVRLSVYMGDELESSINEVLSNPRYSERVKELSMIYHDRLSAPGKEVVHWIEHVVQTRGAIHLRSPALDLSICQRLYLDLVAVVISILIGFLLLLKRISSCFMSVKKYSKKNKKE